MLFKETTVTTGFIQEQELSGSSGKNPVKQEAILEESMDGIKTESDFVDPPLEEVRNLTTKEESASKPEYWFSNHVVDNNDGNLYIEGAASEEPKKDCLVETRNEHNVQELMNLLDLTPIGLQCVIVGANFFQEHQQDLLKEGINVIDMSTQGSDQEKRIIYLSRGLESGKYSCSWCKSTFSSRNDYADHKYLHKKGKIIIPGVPPYLCSVCSKVFSTDKTYRDHCKDFHDISRPHQCSKCSKKFKTVRELKHHVEAYKDHDTCVIQCKKCNKEFKNDDELKSHELDVADAPYCNYFQCKTCSLKFTKEDYREHCTTVHIAYKCAECSKAFYNSSSLRSHMKNVHATDQNICHECGKQFKNVWILKGHTNTVHGDKKYICDKCPQQFKSQATLRKHGRKMHSGPQLKFFSCDKCEKSFHERHNLMSHIKLIHSPVLRLSCLICGEGFVRKDYLKRHVSFHEKYMQLSCEVCKHSFSSKSRLESHKVIGHDENGKPLDYGKKVLQKFKSHKREILPNGKVKSSLTMNYPNKPCVCNICNKVLRNPVNLKLHYKAHLKIKEFRCDKCEIALQTPTSYKNHMKKHEDPNFELRCLVCHARKSSPQELKAHIEKVHKNKKYKCKYCPAKFWRKYLMFSHESLKHKDELEKKKKVLEMLTSNTVEAPENSWVPNMRKGSKLDHLDADIEELIETVNPNEEASGDQINVTESGKVIVKPIHDILSEEYQKNEELQAMQHELTNIG